MRIALTFLILFNTLWSAIFLCRRARASVIESHLKILVAAAPELCIAYSQLIQIIKMGDRNNPIKFGPEWLRNLSQERNTGGSANNNQNPPNSGTLTNSAPTGSVLGSTVSSGALSPPGPPGAMGVTVSPGGTTAQGAAGGSTSNTSASTGAYPKTTTNNTAPKILLANLRYGREEMLALYDRSAEAPEELKYFDLLYQPRGKPPAALNNTFEEEMRDNIRGGPPTGGMPSADRFGVARGGGRGSSNDNRGRSRTPFSRQGQSGRGNSWHTGHARQPGYNTASDEDGSPLRPWGANNGNPSQRNNNEQQEWVPNKVFRRRQANNTNWRQPQTRDEGDEWRSGDAARNRPNVDKWDRDWGDRPVQDRPQSWNSNRRPWVGGEGHNDDNLPEWAVDSAETGAGTFDSTGAFHGYSNDDTSLPKTQDTPFPLVRSHTHGSFVRSKNTEEGSEEWWASEKAKKLSPKRFDASEIKFKKPPNTPVNEENNSVPKTDESETEEETNTNNEEENNVAEKLEGAAAIASETHEEVNTSDDQKNAFKPKFTESKTFDALMRSDIDMEEVSDDRGNFQSVMITPTNSLRQKHQNFVASATENTVRHGHMAVLRMLQSMSPNNNDSCQSPEDKLVEDIFDLTLEETTVPTSNPTYNKVVSKLEECKQVVCNKEVCNQEVCNQEVCNQEVCNQEVCNQEVCNQEVCNLEECNLEECNLEECNLEECNLQECNLEECNQGECNREVECNLEPCRSCSRVFCNKALYNRVQCNKEECRLLEYRRE
ncbi:unnamed protein product, partial [Iphiclides podalirius]